VSACDPGAKAQLEACRAIARALPDFFTTDAVAQIRRDLARHPTYVVEERTGQDWTVTGFAVVVRKNAAVAELAWLAVHPDRQGRGHGSTLLATVAASLQARGIALLEVKTLAPEAAYAPYEATRRFYARAGFVQLETIDPYPGWDPGNPCAIYVKILIGEA
jgi:ribosomal protein S18 acetylase RimI-like enzyme